MAQAPKTPRKPGEAKHLHGVPGTDTILLECAGDHRDRRPFPTRRPSDLAMMDVCFQLLIFFVLTASFAVGEGVLPADLPVGQGKKSDDTKPPEQPITILVRTLGGQDVAIEIQGRPRPLGKDYNELFRELQALQYDPKTNPSGAYDPEAPVIIKPDGTVPWVHVVNAFNAAVRAKYQNVNFAKPQN